MNDRELLELAAKAGEVEGEYFYGILNDSWVEGILTSDQYGNQYCWNPLTDDGDALRLAVKLRINIYNPPTGKTSASICHGDDGSEICSYFNERSPEPAATRRAIVRAAAAIAEGEK